MFVRILVNSDVTASNSFADSGSGWSGGPSLGAKRPLWFPRMTTTTAISEMANSSETSQGHVRFMTLLLPCRHHPEDTAPPPLRGVRQNANIAEWIESHPKRFR